MSPASPTSTSPRKGVFEVARQLVAEEARQEKIRGTSKARGGCPCSVGICAILLGRLQALRRGRSHDGQPSVSRHVSDTVRHNLVQEMQQRMASASDLSALLLTSSVERRPVRDSYEYLEQIGAGSFGTVYKARQLRTGEERAIKEIPLDGLEADKHQVDFELEAMIRLSHPNIVKLYEFFEDANKLYIVTEICNGGDFSDLNHGIDDPREVKILFRDLMMAVAYCHDLGVAHRDLKFQNCLIQKVQGLRNVAKVIDFGLVAIRRAHEEGRQQLETMVGTEYFLAPEAILGSEQYGLKVDCWAIGVMLYMVLTDEHPFIIIGRGRRHSRRCLFRAIIENEPRQAPLDHRSVEESACDLIIRSLQSDPDERLTAQEMLRHPWLSDISATAATWKYEEELESASEVSWITEMWQRYQSKDFHLDNDTFWRLYAFCCYTPFERALLTLAAHFSMSEDIEEWRVAFEQLDASKSGSLSKEEVCHAVESCQHSARISRKEIDDIYNALDANHTGKVNYVKWIAATMDPELMCSGKIIEEICMFFDPARNGSRSRSELFDMLGCDGVNAERPDAHEFKLLLRQISKNLKKQCLEIAMDHVPAMPRRSSDDALVESAVQTWLG